MIQAIRTLGANLDKIDTDLVAMKRALYGLIFTILAGLIVFVVTFNFTGH